MNNIKAWKEYATQEHGSVSEGVRYINNILGLKLAPTCINQMAKGKKNVPVPLVNYINRLMFLKKIKKENYKFDQADLEEFIKTISLPERIK